MRRVRSLLIAATLAIAQDTGQAIFNKSCAVGYCHGSAGTAGRAPRLSGRNYEHKFVWQVTREGIANSGMPGWKDRLSASELDAVIAYVVTISGGKLDPALTNAPSPSAPRIPPEARRGRELFFDATRGEGRCSTCHALEEMGIAIGPNLVSGGPYDRSVARDGRPATVRRARAGAETISALLVEQRPGETVVYDLALPLPVLRTFPKGGVEFSGGAEWRHARAVTKYSDADLDAILAYLKWVAGR
jgi:mono/diheme cytochrome c family protein